MQEGGPDSLRKGCWRSSWAVALCKGSLTSIRSRKDRSTEDTWRSEEVPSFCLVRQTISKPTDPTVLCALPCVTLLASGAGCPVSSSWPAEGVH